MKTNIEKDNSYNTIDYKVQKNGKDAGTAQLEFLEIGENVGELMDDLFTKKGHKSGEVVAHISDFYPHGWRADSYECLQDQMRQGLGTEILEDMLQECTKKGISLLYISTDIHYMENFCEKHDFKNTKIPGLNSEAIYFVKEL
jgi:GNAT superfamily N-acetyltransferase|tara:strand:+ start:730 stop:1158 length:429 start_codon:yes stop_codon:yes gene_type:complete